MIGDITIGHGASIDVDVLLATRGLIQSNSGGGKSWLLRRLAEQMEKTGLELRDMADKWKQSFPDTEDCK